MQTKNITIEITPDDFETLASALELYIEKEIETSPALANWLDTEIDLMREFVRLGHSFWLAPTRSSVLESLKEGKISHDVDEWLEYLKEQANVDNSPKKSKKRVVK